VELLMVLGMSQGFLLAVQPNHCLVGKPVELYRSTASSFAPAAAK
jgi:hypothetical protein